MYYMIHCVHGAELEVHWPKWKGFVWSWKSMSCLFFQRLNYFTLHVPSWAPYEANMLGNSSKYSYFLAIIFWYSSRTMYPRHRAWVDVTTWANRSSLISSKAPSRPALKNTWNLTWILICAAHSLLISLLFSVLTQIQTLVCPNLYCVWSTSMEPSSFSAAFLLSINCPSGTALALRILYLQEEY